MFCSGDYMILIDTWSRSLQGFYNSHRHARREVRIFAISLFGPAPARIPAEIQIRPKHLLTPASTRLQRPRRKDSANEFRIPCGRECDWLRKAGAALGHVPVKYFVVKNHRDTESGVLDEPFLNCVRKLGSFARVLKLSLSRYLADAVFHDF